MELSERTLKNWINSIRLVLNDSENKLVQSSRDLLETTAENMKMMGGIKEEDIIPRAEN